MKILLAIIVELVVAIGCFGMVVVSTCITQEIIGWKGKVYSLSDSSILFSVTAMFYLIAAFVFLADAYLKFRKRK